MYREGVWAAPCCNRLHLRGSRGATLGNGVGQMGIAQYNPRNWAQGDRGPCCHVAPLSYTHSAAGWTDDDVTLLAAARYMKAALLRGATREGLEKAGLPPALVDYLLGEAVRG
ncbi:MAG: hypothetical protein EOM68_24845 [Spirochaetia bacterium]|nr:hypothetical protein [Spirochaetia bacterium]